MQHTTLLLYMVQLDNKNVSTDFEPHKEIYDLYSDRAW